ncbi:hypothetical protein Glove_101g12 [Diversispora epigaea]|uniref:Uncharacterized protein n=1 Tax=Diversispora epigaea TaxID=1348612 RepID=A0A397JDB1_9GLOM|nr:hypothetical protein Glove_101g12 [Diversispora epigaea]
MDVNKTRDHETGFIRYILKQFEWGIQPINTLKKVILGTQPVKTLKEIVRGKQPVHILKEMVQFVKKVVSKT